ncbi:hypothetical protein BCR43DRAFT_489881 [Syncephalastrum racemosum]|uniref:Phosphodiesterase n=1 Tax=Syncephalastrum racemosum TaxID=13706 RepID=A0A1X2HF05_SYNRA|nr:hypothetical protein BCR43DRAFT_489881 [Syncephalastrum racemosum]
MNPSECNVILARHQHLPVRDPAVDILDPLFKQVTTAEPASEVLQLLTTLQQSNIPTLLLVDLDSLQDRSQSLDFLCSLIKHIEKAKLKSVVPIAYSSDDSFSIMLECLHLGSADYIVKPLELSVAKTMFLNVTRYRFQRLKANDLCKASPLLRQSQNLSPPGEAWVHFQNRLKAVFMEDAGPRERHASRGTDLSSNLSEERIAELKSFLCKWEFSSLDLEPSELTQCVFLIFDQVLSCHDLGDLTVSKESLYDFVSDVCASYHNTNPYHNFHHAVDVLQTVYFFLCKMGTVTPLDKAVEANTMPLRSPGRLLQPMDVLALLMASIGHDVGHPGVNNMFMVNSGAPLAILYNDRSVLESFHSMTFFHLLYERPFCELTDPKVNPEYAGFRKSIVHTILATDMGMHKEYMEQIRERSKHFFEHEPGSPDHELNRLTLCAGLIKCADLCNCARPFPIARRWAECLREEFFKQGDLERELGMPVFPINERGKIPLEDFQLGFIKNVALELFELLGSIIPEMQFCVSMMNENIRRWEEIKGHNPHDSGVADVPSAEENDDDLSGAEKKEEIRPYDLTHPEEDERHDNKRDNDAINGNTGKQLPQENGSPGNEIEHLQENHRQPQQKQQQEPSSSPQVPHYTSHPAPRLSLSEPSPPMLAGYDPPTANPSSGQGLATGCHCIIQ